MIKLQVCLTVKMRNRKFKYLSFLSFVLFLWQFYSCDIINPDEEIPSYISIDSISLKTNDANIEGIASESIQDAWIYIDNNLIGVYELPITFPILKEGTQNITIYPGIFLNGIASVRKSYNFYKPYIVTTNLEKGKVTKITPETGYTDNTTFIIEDFEDVGIMYDTTAYSKVSLDRATSEIPSKQETYIGKISLTTAKNSFDCITSEGYNLPRSGAPVFLEIDYKNDIEFVILLYALNNNDLSSGEIVTIRSSSEWKKMYINLTTVIADFNSADKYFIGIYAKLPSDQTEANILLDNLKIIHTKQ